MEWREREHEDQDSVALDDPNTFQALRNHSLYKYWIILGMKAHVELMTWLVRTWDFLIQVKSLNKTIH